MRLAWFLSLGVLQVTLAGGLVNAAVVAQAGRAAAKLKNPVAVSAESVAAGQKVYLRYCRSCHGATGGGGRQGEVGPPPSNLADAKWDRGSTDGEIFSAIRDGIPPDFYMEEWGDRISDNDIWNVVNFIRSLAKK